MFFCVGLLLDQFFQQVYPEASQCNVLILWEAFPFLYVLILFGGSLRAQWPVIIPVIRLQLSLMISMVSIFDGYAEKFLRWLFGSNVDNYSSYHCFINCCPEKIGGSNCKPVLKALQPRYTSTYWSSLSQHFTLKIYCRSSYLFRFLILLKYRSLNERWQSST